MSAQPVAVLKAMPSPCRPVAQVVVTLGWTATPGLESLAYRIHAIRFDRAPRS